MRLLVDPALVPPPLPAAVVEPAPSGVCPPGGAATGEAEKATFPPFAATVRALPAVLPQRYVTPVSPPLPLQAGFWSAKFLLAVGATSKVFEFADDQHRACSTSGAVGAGVSPVGPAAVPSTL